MLSLDNWLFFYVYMYMHVMPTCTCRYLDNILSHPGEEKYTKIPMNNKSFKEKVQSVHGATLYLEAVGFQQHLLPHKGQSEAVGGLAYYNIHVPLYGYKLHRVLVRWSCYGNEVH